MRILIFCPTFRLETETLDALMRMDYGAHEVDILFARSNPCAVAEYNHVFQYRKARQIMLGADFVGRQWDAMMIVESDMIPPADALLKLAAADADVAHGLYVHRHALERGRLPVSAQVRGEGVDAFMQPDELRRDWGKTIPVIGGALGCAFIHRRVLEVIDFRLLGDSRVVLGYADQMFTADVAAHQFRVVCDLSVIVGHRQPDGVILWPDRLEYVRREQSAAPSPYHLRRPALMQTAIPA